jgi:hypothetical protein
MKVPRADVAAMLVPVFLPFNLLKGGINASLTMLLYKPAVSALRHANLIQTAPGCGRDRKTSIWVFLIALAVLAGCILVVLVWKGII